MTSTRRPRGEPRRLALEAARALFARQDYRRTTTKEIAEAAGIAEHLLFRHFGSKAALFHEAVVVPFLEVVDDLAARWSSIRPGSSQAEAVGREFLGRLYDLFVENRGLVMTLWAEDALSPEELAETGLTEIDRAMGILAGFGAEAGELLGVDPVRPDLAARSTVAMVAGMAAFGDAFFGGSRPPREEIVEELTQATLHGFLHRTP